MKYATLLVLACTLWGTNGYPYRFYGTNMDTISYGSSDNRHGGVVLNRQYNPYYNPGNSPNSGNAAFLYKPEQQNQQASQYYQPDRRRQTTPEAYAPQQSDAYYPQAPESAFAPEPTELTEPLPTEKVEIPTTIKAIALPIEIEEVEEPKETKEIAPAPKKRVTKKKQVKKPVDDEDEEEEEEHSPKIPVGTYFPMFFGWGGGRSSGGAPKGATAIANAFSTGRGAAANSHAIAYGHPQPETKLN